MRQWTVCAVILLFASPAMGSMLQESSDDYILTDPEGDAEPIAIEDDGSSTQSARAQDLRGFRIDESETQLNFIIQVAGLEDTDRAPGTGDGLIVVDFLFGNAMRHVESDESEDGSAAEPEPRDRFRLELDHWDSGAEARLLAYDWGRGEYVPVFYVCDTSDCETAVITQPEEALWHVPIPRDAIQDADGTTANPTRTLHHFLISSYAQWDARFFQSGPTDQMPDDGEATGEYVPIHGLENQRGHLALSCAKPTRWSNGEERSYIFYVTLEQQGTQTDEVRLGVADVPDGWGVQLPAETLVMDGGRQTILPVVLDVPFGHEHGAYESVIIQATSAIDADALGQVELGIRYSKVPQPTGHHSQLWIHAADRSDSGGAAANPTGAESSTTNEAFMTTLAPDDQPGSVEANIQSDERINYDRGFEARWGIPLEPPLNMGLDFNLSQVGIMEIPFLSPRGMDPSGLTGALYYRTSGDWGTQAERTDADVKLATIVPTDGVPLPAGETVIIKAELHPTRQADYVSHNEDGAFVFFDLRLKTPKEEQDRSDALMVPGGTIQLPLDEYQDNFEFSYQPLNDVSFAPLQDEVLYVNPGESRLFSFELSNQGVANERFGLIVTGPSAHWATILGDTVIDLPSDSVRTVEVVVTAPPEAWHGERAGPLVQAISQNDPRSGAEIRAIVEVDTENDHPDDSSLLPQNGDTQESPQPLVLLLAALGCAAVARRARRS